MGCAWPVHRSRPHLWLRAETRPNERRAGLAPEGARALLDAGWRLTVEESAARIFPAGDYPGDRAPEGAWPRAPEDAIVFGLKELPEDTGPLRHAHLMFGHAYKGQPAGRRLLDRLAAGGGTLLDLEYLTDPQGRRRAAFGHWAGYAGAAVALHVWAAQRRGRLAGPVRAHDGAPAMLLDLQAALAPLATRPTAIVVGALGRVGRGATELLAQMGVPCTLWDVEETAGRHDFPEILAHDLLVNAILAAPGAPVLVPADAPRRPRALSVIADVACDPRSDFSPIRVYDAETTWDLPATRVAEDPPLDVTAIDNLPSLLPRESSGDFAAQLLPVLLEMPDDPQGTWFRARNVFLDHRGPPARRD